MDITELNYKYQLKIVTSTFSMATGFPEYKFVLGNKKPILYIGGYQLLFNRMKDNGDGDKTAYFYCVNKVKHGVFCSSSAKAMVVLDDAAEKKYFLAIYIW